MNRPQFKERKWKLLFFILITINALVFIVIISIGFHLFKPIPERELPNVRSKIGADVQDAPFFIHTTKEKLTEVINRYINANNEPFTILLDEYVELFTEVDLIGMSTTLHIKFEPIVDSSGNLMLKQHSMSFGLLQIPNHYALQYIGNIFDLPEWVYVLPEEELIYIEFQHVAIGETIKIQLESFDLKENDIVFALIIDD